MPYGVKVLLDDVDITDKVSRLEITAGLEAYCRELSLDIADPDLFDSFDFSTLPTAPVVEVQTRIDTDWVSQGFFFVEKPTYRVGLNATETGVWGRSTTALLGPPFAVKITRSWETATTFHEICEEMCEACGLTWNASYSEVSDFVVYANTYIAELKYPVEIVKELLELAHGESAHLSTDAAGHVCIRLVVRTPSVADHTVTDPVAVDISEEPGWPDFGNRIRISSAGSLSGYSVQLVAPSSCLSADTETRTKLLARVTDTDGLPVENVPVNWSAKHSYVTFESSVTNTKTVYFSETIRAKNFNEIDVQFPPDTVWGVYAYRDFLRSFDISEAGYTIDGNTIRLTNTLSYCDQLLVVQYTSKGIAVNYVTAGSTAGTERITADVSGQTATVDLYLNNPCSCPATLSLRADPSSIDVGASSGLLAYVEIGGAPVRDGRSIWMSLDSSPVHGHIDWTQAYLGRVTVRNEEVQVQNVIFGVSQVELSMFPYSVTGVYRTTVDSEGGLVKTGASLYASHVQKVVNLDELLSTGVRLLVDYVAVGAASNVFDGITPGTDVVRAMIQTSREEVTEARVSISVTQEGTGGGDNPDGCCNEGLCQTDRTPCNPAPEDCESGKIWCPRSGVWGCYAASECDVCGEGKVTCNKDGVTGCYASNECSATPTDGGISKRYGVSAGTEGCWTAEEIDDCGFDEVKCYKAGTLGCFPFSECDDGYGGSAIECSVGTICCEHKKSGLKGCWPNEQCEGSGSKGGGIGDHDKSGHTQCRKNDGSMVTCMEGKTCCEKGGERNCWPPRECDQGPSCETHDCQDDPTDACLNARFGSLTETCTCDDLCQAEFEEYGTIQSYDGGSYRTFEEIVEQDYGLSPDTPEFWEKYGEIRIEAFDQCRTACGACAQAPALTLAGSDAVTAPGGYQYTGEGGFKPYTWEVSGTGATISDDGMVTLEAGACGTFTVTLTDGCGTTASMGARVTNAGRWISTGRQDITSTCKYSAYGCLFPKGASWIDGVNRYVDCYGATAVTVCTSTGQTFESVLPDCSPPVAGPMVINTYYDCTYCAGCQKTTYCFLQCLDAYEWSC